MSVQREVVLCIAGSGHETSVVEVPEVTGHAVGAQSLTTVVTFVNMANIPMGQAAQIPACAVCVHCCCLWLDLAHVSFTESCRPEEPFVATGASYCTWV